MKMDFESVKPPTNTAVKKFDSTKMDLDTAVPVKETEEVSEANQKKVQNQKNGDDENGLSNKAKKEPSKTTIDAAFSDMNAKVKRQKTRCEYSYDEVTKRISIKVYDKETEELIREVPPEESLEVLQKVWELAGIVVDEKR